MEPATAAAPSLPRSPEEIRAEFPILDREVHGRRIAYLDNGATSQKPERVIAAIDRFYREQNANVHRGVYTLSEEATSLYERARATVAKHVGAGPGEVVFVRNATEAINLVAHSWGRANVGEGDTILLTELEHHSNIVPWQVLAAERGARLEYVPIDGEGRLDMDELDRLLALEPRIVAVAHISNVLGTVNPIEEIARRAAAVGARVLVDGAQAAPKLPLDLSSLGADFYAFTSHKMYGPTGLGVLWARREQLEEMPPFITGGSMIGTVERDSSTWAAVPAKFEGGTPAIAEAVAFAEAVHWLDELGLEAVHVHEDELAGHLLERLSEVPGLQMFGPPAGPDRAGIASFAIEGIHPHDIAEIVDRHGVCVRAGHHCAQPLMRRLGVAATTRASLAVYNDRDDVDRLIEALQDCRRVFKLD